ncbi:MAG: type II secretion system protein [Desulforegulaceae bacterium]|nr:type II secretion system protein [Desulforegulaceae bacterium]
MIKLSSKNGFTLIEIIVSLIVASILASILITLMQSVFSKTGQSLLETSAAHRVGVAMDRITAVYTDTGANSAAFLEKLSDETSNKNFKLIKTWYDSPPFNDEGVGSESGALFLKIEIIDNLSPSISLTSIFWLRK